MTGSNSVVKLSWHGRYYCLTWGETNRVYPTSEVAVVGVLTREFGVSKEDAEFYAIMCFDVPSVEFEAVAA